MIRQTGSAMKPVAVLAPAIDKKIVTNSTIIADEPTTFTDYNGELYSPTDYDDYRGSITLRQAVESSQNIPFVKIMEDLTPQVSIKYLKKMGITTLNDNDVNLALSLGGLDKGISPLELAGAYSTIANDGVYTEPTFYSNITTKSNKTFLESKQKSRRVFSKNVACVLKQLLKEPVEGSNGTARYCAISGMDVAAKTGTTNENYDRWLCGFTPYYTMVSWYGFDMNESIDFNGRNPAGLMWSSVMTQIHSNLSNAKFEITSGVVTATICKDSGEVATSNCTNTYTEYFLKRTVPDTCSKHPGSALTNSTSKPSTNKNTNKQNSENSSTPQNDSTTTNNTQTQNDSENTRNNTTNSSSSPSENRTNTTTNSSGSNTQNQHTESNTTTNTTNTSRPSQNTVTDTDDSASTSNTNLNSNTATDESSNED